MGSNFACRGPLTASKEYCSNLAESPRDAGNYLVTPSKATYSDMATMLLLRQPAQKQLKKFHLNVLFCSNLNLPLISFL
jgi:hypothetical protein